MWCYLFVSYPVFLWAIWSCYFYAYIRASAHPIPAPYRHTLSTRLRHTQPLSSSSTISPHIIMSYYAYTIYVPPPPPPYYTVPYRQLLYGLCLTGSHLLSSLGSHHRGEPWGQYQRLGVSENSSQFWCMMKAFQLPPPPPITSNHTINPTTVDGVVGRYGGGRAGKLSFTKIGCYFHWHRASDIAPMAHLDGVIYS